MSAIQVSSLLLGDHPERLQPPPGGLARLVQRSRHGVSSLRRFGRMPMPDPALASIDQLRASLASNPQGSAQCEAALAHVARACQASLGLSPYASQLEAARALLRGQLVEMATGEGKTLAVGLAAACGALAGRPVHVVTANDYLASRDSASLTPLYESLGLTCGYVVAAADRQARQDAYSRSITYCPARELVFDYLRDGVAAPRSQTPLLARIAQMGARKVVRQSLLRGLWMAIVDEADSVLLDEAMMPLVLSRPGAAAEPQEVLELACDQARSLTRGLHFELDAVHRRATLTETGRLALRGDASACARFRTLRHQAEYVETALSALHLHARDRDYLVRAATVQIIDEATGRAAPGRVWSRELHSFVCIKEGCPPPASLRTVAQITFQRFFPRYLHLCGTSGTLREERRELSTVYGLQVVHVPRRLPLRLQRWPTRLFPDREAQIEAIVQRAVSLCASGRPVLIAMDTVSDADRLSERLLRSGVANQLLHARQDRSESDQIARAGLAGMVTVTTNMAGRGTDIRVDAEVARRGGLHVIACQHNRARRIDRQLCGRTARQGDPGSCERWVSITQGLFEQSWRPLLAWPGLARGLARCGAFADLLLDIAQWRAERRARAARRALLERERERARTLEIGPDT
jgi:preprotein translocase subunit SecA